MNKFNTAVDFTKRASPSGDAEISTAVVGGYHRVMLGGKIIRTFTGPDAERQARGYALALLDERPLQPQRQP
jgi:hypothetical protein